jgi:hypothetical protein
VFAYRANSTVRTMFQWTLRPFGEAGLIQASIS